MTEFDDFLTGELRRRAGAIRVENDPDVSPILSAGAARQARSRRLAMLATFSVLAVATAGTVAVVAVAGSDAPVGVADDPAAVTEVAGFVEATVVSTTEPVVGTTRFVSLAESVPGQGVTPADPLTPIEPQLSWSRSVVPATAAVDASAFGWRGVVGTSPFYVVSTAAGERDTISPRSVLYRSADAINWIAAPTPPPPSPGWKIAAGDGGLYAVGTAPVGAAAREGDFDVAVQRSLDDGVTWTPLTIAPERTPLRKMRGVRDVGVTLEIAATADAVVVVGVVSVGVDVESLLPGVDTSWGFSALPDALRVSVRPSDECLAGNAAPVATDAPTAGGAAPAATAACGLQHQDYPWSTLDIDQAIVDVIRQPLRLWRSTDGVSFTSVTPPEVGPTVPYGISLVSGRQGFAAYLPGNSEIPTGAQLLTSADGTTWNVRALAPEVASAPLDLYGDRLLLSGGAHPTAPDVVSVSDDFGATWRTTRLAGFLTEADGPAALLANGRAVIGEDGITVVAQVFIDVRANGGVSLRRDGVRLTFDETPQDAFFDDASGELLATATRPSVEQPGGWRFDNDSTGDLVLIAPDGSERVRFSPADVEEAFDAAARPWTDGRVVRTLVLHSVDGVQWSREWLHDIAGPEVGWAKSLVSTPNGVVITANTQDFSRDNPPQPGPRDMVAIVGTRTA